MSRNGSGTYVQVTGIPVTTGTVIQSSVFNNFATDIGNEITNSLSRDGSSPMTNPLKLIDGTTGVPALTFNSESGTGIYRPGAAQIALTTNGVTALTANAGAVGIGTSTPATYGKLAVSGGNIYLDTGYNYTAANGGGYWASGYASPYATGWYDSSGSMLFRTSSQTRLFIDANGNIGIGSSPSTKLDVVLPANDYTTLANTLGIRGPSSSGLYVGTHNDAGGAGADIVARGYSATMGDFRFIAANGSYLSPVERMRIAANGNVGIGYIPQTLTGGVGNTLQVGDPINSAGAGMTIGSTTTGDIQFSRANTGANQYAGLIRYSQASDYMALWTASAERVRIDSSGNLSVGGVPNNNYKIHAQGTGSVQVASQGTTDASFITNVNGTQSLYLHSTASLSEVNELRAVPLLFTVNGAERARIDSSGNVGIGGSPTTKLDVISSAASDLISAVRNTGTTGASIQTIASGNGTTSSKYSYVRFLNSQTSPRDWRLGTYGTDNFTIRDETSAANRLVIDTNGNVGINMATAMTYKLEVGASGVIALNDSTNTNKGTLQMTAGGLEMYATGSKYIAFGSNSVERVRIDSSGNLLVGATSTVSSERARIENTSAGGVPNTLRLTNAGTTAGTGANLSFVSYTNATVASTIASISGISSDTAGNGLLAFNTSGVERMRIDASGNVGVAVTPVAKLDINGTVAQNIVAMGAVDMNLATGNFFTKTVSGATTFTISNVPASRYVTWTLKLTNGGSATVAWPAAVKWPNGVAPVLTASGKDILSFFSDDGGTTVYGVLSAKDIK